MESIEIRRLYYIATAFFIVLMGCISLTYLAMYIRPLNPERAYDALVENLRNSQAGPNSLNLSETTFMQRGNDLIFYGQGQVRSADKRKEMPVIENFYFQYIGVVRRKNCSDWVPDCYITDGVEITGKKFARPML